MRRIVQPLLIVATLGTQAAGDSTTLSGRWVTDLSTPPEDPLNPGDVLVMGAALDLRSDGTCRMEILIDLGATLAAGGITVPLGELRFSVSGVWTANGDWFEATPDTSTAALTFNGIDSKDPDFVPALADWMVAAGAAPEEAAVEAATELLRSDGGAEYGVLEGEYVVEGDTLTLTEPDGTVTLLRREAASGSSPPSAVQNLTWGAVKALR